jgi:hypothetical protein
VPEQLEMRDANQCWGISDCEPTNVANQGESMKYLVALGLLALATAANAQQQSVPASPPAAPSNLPVEVLAHFFLSSSDSADRLKDRSIVSEAGLAKLKSANEHHFQKVHGDKELSIEARQLCKDLTKVENGAAVAAPLIASEKRERERAGKAAKLALADMDPQDRQELENWLNTDFRRGFRGNGMGSELTERFASEPFPSDVTKAATQRACEAATVFEKRVNEKRSKP